MSMDVKTGLLLVVIRSTELFVAKDGNGTVSIATAHDQRLAISRPSEIGEACIVHIAETADRTCLLCVINPDAILGGYRIDHTIGEPNDADPARRRAGVLTSHVG